MCVFLQLVAEFAFLAHRQLPPAGSLTDDTVGTAVGPLPGRVLDRVILSATVPSSRDNSP